MRLKSTTWGWRAQPVRLVVVVILSGLWTIAAGSAAQVQMWCPSSSSPADSAFSIECTAQGQVYLACADSAVRKVSTNSPVAVKIGTTGVDLRSAGAGYMGRGTATDALGNFYFTDGTRIFRMDNRGVTARISAEFQDAIDIEADRAGNLYVAEARQCAVYKLNPQQVRTRLILRGYRYQMREMLVGLALDAAGRNLYLAERYSGMILRYRLAETGEAGSPEVIARDIVSLRSIAVDEKGNIFANIDFPIILRIAPDRQQSRFIIPNNNDFCMGRIALGVVGEDRDNLYVPTKEGVLKISNAGGI